MRALCFEHEAKFPAQNMRVSIVIPTLNEAQALPATLHALHDQIGDIAMDVVVVDANSSDATQRIARTAGVDVLNAPRGRAVQMNRGAHATSGEVLLFLHADTQLPPDALQQLTRALSTGSLWGRFDVQIVGQVPLLKVVGYGMNMRSRLSGIATGDQAIFVTRAAFTAVGGFPAQSLMEDIALSRQLKRLGKPACLRTRVATSGRRWETRGMWRTIWLMWRLRFAYWRGVSPEQLAALYQ